MIINICLYYILGIYIGVYLNVKPLFLLILLAILLIIEYSYKNKNKNKNKNREKTRTKTRTKTKTKTKTRIISINLSIYLIVIIIAVLRINYIESKRNVFLENNPGNKEYIIKIISREEKEYSNKYIAKIRNENYKISFNSKVELDITKNYIVSGKLELFDEELNYKGFNNRKYNYSKGIDFNFKLSDKEVKLINENKENKDIKLIELSVFDKALLFKESINKGIEESIKNSVIFKALFLGDKNLLDEDLKEDFRSVNLYHILAMSGMHIGSLVLILNFIFKNTNINISFKLKKTIKTLILLSYMILIGMSSSVSRAVLIVAISLIFEEFNIRLGFINSIILSIFLTLLLNPYTIYNQGFYLSYIATLTIYFSLNIEDNLKIFPKLINRLKIDVSPNWQERDILIGLENKLSKIKNRNFIKKKAKRKVKKNENNVSNKNNENNNNQKVKIKRQYTKKVLKLIFYNIYISITVYISLFPLLVYYFGVISINFFLANLLIAPIFPIIMIVGFVYLFVLTLSIVLEPSLFQSIIQDVISVLSRTIDLFLSVFLNIVELTKTNKSNSFIYLKQPSILFMFSHYILLGILFYFFATKKTFESRSLYIKYCISRFKTFIINKKILACILIILLLFSNIVLDIPNMNSEYRFSFIYVGQGDSSFIRTPMNKTILVDTGDDKYFDNGKEIRRYILARRHQKIDHLFISHFDSDHIGGVYTLINSLKIDKIYIPKYVSKILKGEELENYNNLKNLVDELNIGKSIWKNKSKIQRKRKFIEVIELERGDRVLIDKYTYIEILFPTSDLINKNPSNNNSLVLKLNCRSVKYNKDFSILYTGDIEKTGIIKLLDLDDRIEGNSFRLKSNILKVPHHGSNSSLSEEFINRIKPNISIISSGKNNIYRHPHIEIINLLEKADSKIYRTDIDGEIYLKEKTIFSY